MTTDVETTETTASPATVLALPATVADPDPACEAVNQLRQALNADYANLCASTALARIRQLIDDADRIVFDIDHAGDYEDADPTVTLLLIRDAAGLLLWFNPDIPRLYEVAELAQWAREHGTPPQMAEATEETICGLLVSSVMADPGHFGDACEKMPAGINDYLLDGRSELHPTYLGPRAAAEAARYVHVSTLIRVASGEVRRWWPTATTVTVETWTGNNGASRVRLMKVADTAEATLWAAPQEWERESFDLAGSTLNDLWDLDSDRFEYEPRHGDTVVGVGALFHLALTADDEG